MTSHPLQLRRRLMRLPKRWRMWIVLSLIAVFLLALSLLWSAFDLQDVFDVDSIAGYLRELENSPSALMWVIALYALAAVTFFSAALLSTAVILVFAGAKGFVYSMIGSLVCAMIGYAMGRMIGRDRMERHFPASRRLFRKVHNSGIIGVAVVRAIPVAPYAAINVVFGVIKMPLLAYLAGTFLGLIPGKLMLAIFGMSIRDFIIEPNWEQVMQALAFIALWAGVIYLCHWGARKWQEMHPAQAGTGR